MPVYTVLGTSPWALWVLDMLLQLIYIFCPTNFVFKMVLSVIHFSFSRASYTLKAVEGVGSEQDMLCVISVFNKRGAMGSRAIPRIAQSRLFSP